MMRTLTLHIGTPKSGTTSLQTALSTHGAALAGIGRGYAAPRGDINASAAVADLARTDTHYWARSTHAQRRHLAAVWRSSSPGAAVGRLHAGTPVDAEHLILSAENLSLAGPQLIRRALDLFPDRVVRVVVVRRPATKGLTSNYWQIAKMQVVPPFAVWLRRELRAILARDEDAVTGWAQVGPLEQAWRGSGEVTTVHLPGMSPATELGRAMDVIVGVPGIITDLPRLNVRHSAELTAALQMTIRTRPHADRRTLQRLLTTAAAHDPGLPSVDPIPAALAELIDDALGVHGRAEPRAELAALLRDGAAFADAGVRDPLGEANVEVVELLARHMRRDYPLALGRSWAARSWARVGR